MGGSMQVLTTARGGGQGMGGSMQVLTTALGRPRDGQGVRGRAGAMAGAWSSSTRDGAMAGAWSSSTRDPPVRDTYLSQSGPALCRLVA